VTVSWLYGMENIRKDITVMIGSKYTNWTFYIWYALWGAITPGILIVSEIVSRFIFGMKLSFHFLKRLS
jgi:hypothetical protein